MQGIGIDTAREHLAGTRYDRVVGACETGNGVEQDHDVALVLDEALGLLDDHVGDLDVATGRLVERRRNDFAPDRALHLGDLLGTLVDEQHHEVDLGIVGDDRRSNILQQHRLTGFRRRNDQAALAFADRRNHVDDAGREVLRAAVALFELEALLGKQRREVLEQDLGTRILWRVMVDLSDLQQCEIALALLGWANEARNRVAGTQCKAPDLAWTDIDVVRAGQVGTVRRAQEAKAVLQNLEDTLAVDIFALGSMRFQDRKNHVLLARARHALDSERLAKFHKISGRTVLEFRQVHHVLAGFELLRRNYLETSLIIRILVLRRTPTAPTVGAALAFRARLVRAIFR